ncbi:hypothetical protein MESS4_750278 [Mesorhizobium sp. STM 4661]|nr:hypothetical protein MESS4_750278 [Mesorhizobium sp. STM 4661]
MHRVDFIDLWWAPEDWRERNICQTRSFDRFQTVTWWPALASAFATAVPILPTPSTATRWLVVCDVCI